MAIALETTPGKINGRFKGADILALSQFTRTDLETVLDLSDVIEDETQRGIVREPLKGTSATIYFDKKSKSTRTATAFKVAVGELGGNPVTPRPDELSLAKGETFDDTVRVFDRFTSLLIMRLAGAGMVHRVAEIAKNPVINAGEYFDDHPTQGILDLRTIKRRHGTLSRLRGLYVGDILHSRTTHSDLDGMALYEGNEVWLLSDPSLRLQQDRKDRLTRQGLTIHEIQHPDEIPQGLAFVNWTRTPKEWFKDKNEYRRVAMLYTLTRSLADRIADRDTLIMHPLPNSGEIKLDVYDHPNAVFMTDQLDSGISTRKAVALLVTGKAA